MVERQEVEALLAVCEIGDPGWYGSTDQQTVAALCRAWLAVDEQNSKSKSRFTDMTGMTVGRLTVISRAENDHNRRARWLCQCKCGNETVVIGTLLRSGKTKSCGCLHRDTMAVVGPENWKRRWKQ